MDRVPGWEAATIRELHAAAENPETGVRVERGLLASRTHIEAPPPMRELPGFVAADPHELPTGFGAGFWVRMPVVDMPTYLDHLQRRFATAGGTLEIGHVADLTEAACGFDTVVNCTGVGASALADDERVTPVRGQHVVVANPGLEHFFMEGPPGGGHWASFMPHGDEVVLGGVADDGNWSLADDFAEAERIVARCASIESRFADAAVIEHRVGLRPRRDAVRVEVEQLDGVRCIHNYGHGGLGVTLSWGCADEVVSLLATA